MTVPTLASVRDDPFLAQVAALSDKIDAADRTMTVLDRYYEGTQPLVFMPPEVRAQVGDRIPAVNVNWPRAIVDSVQRRCRVDGFRLGTGGAVDAGLWNLWTSSRMPMWARMNHVDALVHGRAFVSVWTDQRGRPRIAPESAHQVAVAYEPGGSEVVAAVKRYADGDRRVVLLYLPEQVRRYSAPAAALAVPGIRSQWRLEEVLPNPLGAVPIVPLVNRPRILNLDGESEITDVLSLTDAVAKTSTDMMVTSEFHAAPRRWATGIEIPDGPNRERMQAETRAYWDQSTKDKTWLAGPGITFGQFAEASLTNFTEAIRLFTTQIAAIAGLPPHYLGINTDNPASADAIRSAESTLVQRAREKHETWGAAYADVMRLAVAVRDGRTFEEVRDETPTLETSWQDPETRTKAQDADAAVKLHAEKIIDTVEAQEQCGISPMRREAIAARNAEAADAAATADITARLNLAQRLVAEDGLTKNAALAAVGLLQAAATNSAESA
jgi:hypothetical protein